MGRPKVNIPDPVPPPPPPPPPTPTAKVAQTARGAMGSAVSRRRRFGGIGSLTIRRPQSTRSNIGGTGLGGY